MTGQKATRSGAGGKGTTDALTPPFSPTRNNLGKPASQDVPSVISASRKYTILGPWPQPGRSSQSLATKRFAQGSAGCRNAPREAAENLLIDARCQRARDVWSALIKVVCAASCRPAPWRLFWRDDCAKKNDPTSAQLVGSHLFDQFSWQPLNSTSATSASSDEARASQGLRSGKCMT